VKPTSPKITARGRFAVNLRKARAAAGLSQEELAAKAGLHRNYVGSVERNEKNISIDAMERLAIALRVDLIELLSREEP
jgi:transcriptional regulator with XRE-family HTH domain